MEQKEFSCPFQRAFGPEMCGMHRRLHEMMAAPGQRMMPVIRGAGIPVDIRNLEDEVAVVADLPGVASGDVAVRLTGPRTLRMVFYIRQIYPGERAKRRAGQGKGGRIL